MEGKLSDGRNPTKSTMHFHPAFPSVSCFPSLPFPLPRAPPPLTASTTTTSGRNTPSQSIQPSPQPLLFPLPATSPSSCPLLLPQHPPAPPQAGRTPRRTGRQAGRQALSRPATLYSFFLYTLTLLYQPQWIYRLLVNKM
ncbi:hypothetical protein Pmani_004736 [Petrolisthes manimaculis]|uniref:Uncharacterized protein n=1 Tax=Petrolisthes manimaculis TaxID=1843537 RepID=A0AAE1QDY5_9EUCA|nr:hypothetical protein Pmani_004736 [Petrolisthes manimaculis]